MRDAEDTPALLTQAARGDERAAEALMPVIYDALRELAGRYLDQAGGSPTLQPTALVHEAYLKLVDVGTDDLRSRTHFQALAARVMRQALIDHARRRDRRKRGGGWQRVTLSDVTAGDPDSVVDLEALETALAQLGEQDERAARVVELRFFAGLPERAIAEFLGVTTRTVRNDWRMARAWLRCALEEGARPA
ncbi:MAG: ECF-type sigma factor [Planctomycetota bacterium]|jgi:RNA polymerase sigma factor (TIGR02999 family)